MPWWYGTRSCLLISLGNRFVQIQQHPRDDGPGGQLGGRRAVGQFRRDAPDRRRRGPRASRPPRRNAAVSLASSCLSVASSLSRRRAGPRSGGRRSVSRSSSLVAAVGQGPQGQGAGAFEEDRLVQRHQRLQRRVRARRGGRRRNRRWARRRSATADTGSSGSGRCTARGDSGSGPVSIGQLFGP